MPAPSGHVVTAPEFSAVATTPTNSTVSNTTTETVLLTYTIPAGSVTAPDMFVIYASGHADITGTPTITFRVRIGGVAGPGLGTIAYTAAANTGRPWQIQADVRCVSTGVSGTWHGYIFHSSRIAGGASPGISAVFDDCTVAAITRDTTVNQDLVLTAQWSVASASNTVSFHSGRISKVLG